MNYIPIVIATIVFFLSFGFFVLAWSKKPTKKHLLEIEEASLEIAHQIQAVTDESLSKIEKKMSEMSVKQAELEKQYTQLKMLADQMDVQQDDKQISKAKEKTAAPKQEKAVAIELKDEKSKKIYELIQKGYSQSQIAKEMDMNIGVVQVYLNMMTFPKTS